MTPKILRFSAFACLLVLAACGSEEREETFATAAYADIKSKYLSKSKKGESGQPAQRDLSWINTNTKPLTIVLVEKWQGMGFLALQVQNGSYKTWRAKDGTTFTFKGPFMSGTKGLGDDLTSAKVPAKVASAGTQNRIHYYLDSEDQIAPRDYHCSWKFVGSETIAVHTKSYNTMHYSESCKSGEFNFKNDYWLDSAGIARQSRQFVSETVGYVSLLKILE